MPLGQVTEKISEEGGALGERKQSEPALSGKGDFSESDGRKYGVGPSAGEADSDRINPSSSEQNGRKRH